LDGKTESEFQLAGRGALLTVLKRLKPLADDDVLAEIVAVYAEEYSALGAKSAAQCYQYVSGIGIPDIPAALLEKEDDINTRVIETAKNRLPVGDAYIATIWKKIGTTLASKGLSEDQFELFSATTVPPDRYGDYCSVATVIFKEMSRLPQSEAAALMREILAGK
jgi:hypothetical protein